jgi:hypothetical protein
MVTSVPISASVRPGTVVTWLSKVLRRRRSRRRGALSCPGDVIGLRTLPFGDLRRQLGDDGTRVSGQGLCDRRRQDAAILDAGVDRFCGPLVAEAGITGRLRRPARRIDRRRFSSEDIPRCRRQALPRNSAQPGCSIPSCGNRCRTLAAIIRKVKGNREKAKVRQKGQTQGFPSAEVGRYGSCLLEM